MNFNPEVAPERWPPPAPRPGELPEAGAHFAATCVGIAAIFALVVGVIALLVAASAIVPPGLSRGCGDAPSGANTAPFRPG